jgi:hypothetical protein
VLLFGARQITNHDPQHLCPPRAPTPDANDSVASLSQMVSGNNGPPPKRTAAAQSIPRDQNEELAHVLARRG